MIEAPCAVLRRRRRLGEDDGQLIDVNHFFLRQKKSLSLIRPRETNRNGETWTNRRMRSRIPNVTRKSREADCGRNY